MPDSCSNQRIRRGFGSDRRLGILHQNSLESDRNPLLPSRPSQMTGDKAVETIGCPNFELGLPDQPITSILVGFRFFFSISRTACSRSGNIVRSRPEREIPSSLPPALSCSSRKSAERHQLNLREMAASCQLAGSLPMPLRAADLWCGRCARDSICRPYSGTGNDDAMQSGEGHIQA
jgi:hypothetical protein